MIKGNYKRIGLDAAQEIFRKAGAVLLASEYQNNSVLMPYLCKCGTHHKMSLANFVKGRQCPECAGRKKWDFDNVRAYYKEQGCELLATEYKGMNEHMRYRCSCGTESSGTFGNFYHKGVRCFSCGVGKISGQNAHQYKPEKTEEERITQRKFPKYKEWRDAVYLRDGFTCQCCGEKGGKLHAHHLNNYADHKELRTEVSNGVTLCVPCHKKFHAVYGQKTITTSAQFAEFLEHRNA